MLKRSKRRGANGTASGTGTASGISCSSSASATEKSDKNGGTWPKARMGPLIQNGTGTILHPRKTKERLPLSVLLNNPPKYESTYTTASPSSYNNRISQPIPLASFAGLSPISGSSNRHTVYKALESPLPSFTKATGHQLHQQKSFVPFKDLGEAALTPSETSIDLSIKSGQDYYAKSKRSTPKYTPLHEPTTDSLASTHNRVHSQLYTPVAGVVPRPAGNFSFPPFLPHSHHPHHPHQQPSSINNSRYPSPPSLPSAQSGESIGLPDARSFSFEPPYSPQPPPHHLHTPSVDLMHYHKPRALHPTMSSYDVPPYVSSHHGPGGPGSGSAGGGYEGGTFPRKKENQRFRVPSNPSVTSKNSIGKLSSGSIEKTSERGSPMPSFHVEILSGGTGTQGGSSSASSSGGVIRSSVGGSKRSSMPDYCYAQPRPTLGQMRRIHIDKSQEPLGIQISCLEGVRGVFVSSVTEHSLASQIGLQVGDQLLDVCGINMRTCDSYQVAANILRQCGNSITMLVQYSPESEYITVALVWFWFGYRGGGGVFGG